MIHDEIFAVVNAESVGPVRGFLAGLLAGIISGTNAQIANDYVVRSGKNEGVATALGLLDTDAVSGRGLAGDCDMGFADSEALGFDQPPHAKDPRARALGLKIREPYITIA